MMIRRQGHAAETEANCRGSVVTCPSERSVGTYLDTVAAAAPIARYQPAELDVEHRLLVDHPFVVAITTQGVAAMTFARFGLLER